MPPSLSLETTLAHWEPLATLDLLSFLNRVSEDTAQLHLVLASSVGDIHTMWVTTSLFAYGDNVAIYDERCYPAGKRPSKPERVIIGNDVWIGENLVLGRNITIGHGAVIAGGSVVVKDVQPYEVVGGNPARHIKFRFPEGMRNLLLESSWWRFHLKDFEGMDITNPESFAKEVIRRESSGDIQPYWPRSRTPLTCSVYESSPKKTKNNGNQLSYRLGATRLNY